MLKEPFLLKSRLPAERVELEFEGRFENHPVRWRATFVAIKPRGEAKASFIDIRSGENDYYIEVGLPVDIIDLPTIRKGVIMIQNYKRLRPGRHEFGAHL